MSKATLSLWAALIGTSGSLFMAGWAAHAEMWAIFTASAFTGLSGMMGLGLMAWIFILD